METFYFHSWLIISTTGKSSWFGEKKKKCVMFLVSPPKSLRAFVLSFPGLSDNLIPHTSLCGFALTGRSFPTSWLSHPTPADRTQPASYRKAPLYPPRLVGPYFFSSSAVPALVSLDSFADSFSVFVSHSVDPELCGVTGQALKTLLFSEAMWYHVWEAVHSHKRTVEPTALVGNSC